MLDQKNQIQKFDYEQKEVRTIEINSEPYFIAKDVCDILELKNVSMAIEKLDEDEKLTSKLLMSGQEREMWLINQSGLYALILRSNKPEAKKFRKWITSEVIPAIMKTGKYEKEIKPKKQKSLPILVNRVKNIAYAFCVRVEIYENGDRAFYSVTYDNGFPYTPNLNDLEQSKLLLEQQIKQLK